MVAGETDDSVPFSHVRGLANRWQRQGLDLTLRPYPADHFLFFSHRHRVVDELVGWVGRTIAAPRATDINI